MGQHLQRHVLEGAGGAVPQLQAVGALVQGVDRGHGGGVELLRAIGGGSKVGELLDGELLQKLLHHIDGPSLIRHVLQLVQGVARQLGDIIGGQQTAVSGQALGDGLGRGEADGRISGTGILHLDHSYLFETYAKKRIAMAILHYDSFPAEGQGIGGKKPPKPSVRKRRFLCDGHGALLCPSPGEHKPRSRRTGAGAGSDDS